MRQLLFWLMMVAPIAAMAAPAIQPAVMPLDDGPDRMATGAARMVGAILEFTHWPTQRPALRLCVAGAVRHAGQLDGMMLSSGARVDAAVFPATGADPAASCDILYVGRLDPLIMRQLVGGARGAAIVTIAEDDPQCGSGAMFCLLFEPRALNFSLNIDAVSRSAVRIDPRVLRMSKGGN